MTTLLAHINVVEGKEAEFEQIAGEMYRATHSEETGVKRYEYWRGEQPGMYYCLLSFDDFRAFLAHQTSEHHEAPDWGSVIAGIRLEWVDPLASGSDLPPTLPQDIAENASELMKQYAETYAVKRAEWWEAVATKD